MAKMAKKGWCKSGGRQVVLAVDCVIETRAAQASSISLSQFNQSTTSYSLALLAEDSGMFIESLSPGLKTQMAHVTKHKSPDSNISQVI